MSPPLAPDTVGRVPGFTLKERPRIARVQSIDRRRPLNFPGNEGDARVRAAYDPGKYQRLGVETGLLL
jgi:hypothetical protein